MAIPFTVDGSFEIPFVDRAYEVEKACAAIEDGLRREQASEISNSGGRIRFKVSIVAFLSRSSPLAGASSGEVTVVDMGGKLRVEFTLQFLSAVLLLTAMLGVAIGQLLVLSGDIANVSRVVMAVLGFTWAFIIIVSHIGSALRFRAFLRRQLREVIEGRH